MPRYPRHIRYSERYADGVFEYVHVILTRETYETIRNRSDPLIWKEWTQIGVEIPISWENYMYFKPEPHILLFRRKLQA